MMVTMLKSKLHGATITDGNVEYEGSLGIAKDLLVKSGLYTGERIDVYNISNGNRFSTYTIEEAEGSGKIVVNGAAAHLAKKGDRIIIASYCLLDNSEAKEHKPVVVKLDGDNKPK